MAFKWSDYFQGFVSKSYSLEEIKKSKYGEYFDHLQKTLEKFSSDLMIYRSANKILSLEMEENLENLIVNILKKIPDFGFESKRLILDLVNGLDDKSITYGEDSKNHHYEYLDDQVSSLLKNNTRVFINDTSKVHPLKFTSGADIPKTVLGFNLDNLESCWGVFWLASSTVITLTKDQVDGLEVILSAVSLVLKREVSNLEFNKINHLLFSVFNNYPQPCLVFGGEKLIYKNQKGSELFSSGENKREKQNIENLFSAVKQKKTHQEIAGRAYRLVSFLEKTDEEDTIVFLFDEEQTTNQREYLHQVMQIISMAMVSPLKNIKGYAEIIPLLAEIDKSQNDYLERISLEAENALLFSRDLLELARLENENPFVLKQVNVGGLVQRLLDASQHLIRQKRITVEKEIEFPEKLIWIDEVLFSQALYLILEYMLDQLSPGQQIIISAAQLDSEFKITFFDNGSGFSEIDLALLNQPEPDSTVDLRIRVAGGIMRFHNGVLSIKSDLGKGSEYSFSWPNQ